MYDDRSTPEHRSERIVLLDGAPSAAYQVVDLLEQLAQRLRQAGHNVDLFKLRDMRIAACSGCWHCWTKTPGLCSQHDDIVKIYPKHAEADLVLFAAPLLRGFISACLKRYIDRIIPFAHPHVLLIDGECRHQHRYAQLPDFAVVIEPEATSDQEDIACNFSYFERTAEHFRTPLRCALTTADGLDALLGGLLGTTQTPDKNPGQFEKAEENHAAMSY